MFANPLWSVAILAGLIGVYIVIRIRHGAPLFAAGSGWLDWIVRFRSWVATALAGVLIALPDIIVALLPVDLSPVIGTRWAPLVTAGLTAFLALNRAFSTKPVGERA